MLAVLGRYGYTAADDPAYVQCFDPDELRRIDHELGSRLKLVQLIGDNSWSNGQVDFAEMRTDSGLAAVATYADGIGPSIPHVLSGRDQRGYTVTSLVADAHRNALVVHPYTRRADALPPYADSFEGLTRALLSAGIDGVFTDFPDRVAALISGY